jgi:hypothetical protein
MGRVERGRREEEEGGERLTGGATVAGRVEFVTEISRRARSPERNEPVRGGARPENNNLWLRGFQVAKVINTMV